MSPHRTTGKHPDEPETRDPTESQPEAPPSTPTISITMPHGKKSAIALGSMSGVGGAVYVVWMIAQAFLSMHQEQLEQMVALKAEVAGLKQVVVDLRQDLTAHRNASREKNFPDD